ncbi:serine/threonine protein kinase [Simplicispira metamorpha]|uniref:Serine/threonine protein kinase n=1 Tax=Simplicispira metamorpha TaxID=80881 RepID=A0A4R2MUT4_9BURK|nr:serine/threonine protein kinase [Simplicispira metamorpha]TCP12548.1 hypothetical protein EV674_13721 [Simplicispira metamorpha]
MSMIRRSSSYLSNTNSKMAYPSLEQYNQAFQLHSKLLFDPDLRTGTVATTGLGLPLAISGGFALTYTIKTASKKYAVRCFHRESKALERRYEAISRRLASLRSPYFLDFQFQPKGISVDGSTFPIVKMAWAKGETLGEFIENNRDNSQALSKLSASIVSLAAFLEKERIAHGDLQTGNLMVSDGGATVQLIDYDGMYVDEIKSLGSAELGHVNFQHPGRKARNPFDASLDRFSLISLWLALKSLATDRSLWDRTNSELDALIFRANDFVDPASSPVFAMLSANNALAADTKNFAIVCKSALDKAPTLSDFVAGRNIPSMEIRITGSTPAGQALPGYIGAYAVLSALEYENCLRKVGDKVEVIGRIIEVKLDKARNGKPYIFINFGDWRGRIFKISIWSEGLAAIKNKPDSSWAGKWISVIGLMEPPYVSNRYKYSHLSITVSTTGQMTVISEVEAKRRLAGSKGAIASNSNQDVIDRIKGNIKPTPQQVQQPVASTAASSNKAVLDRIRATSQPAPTRTQPAPSRPSPTQYHPQPRPTPEWQQPKPQEKGIVSKIFDWLFG